VVHLIAFSRVVKGDLCLNRNDPYLFIDVASPRGDSTGNSGESSRWRPAWTTRAATPARPIAVVQSSGSHPAFPHSRDGSALAVASAFCAVLTPASAAAVTWITPPHPTRSALTRRSPPDCSHSRTLHRFGVLANSVSHSRLELTRIRGSSGGCGAIDQSLANAPDSGGRNWRMLRLRRRLGCTHRRLWRARADAPPFSFLNQAEAPQPRFESAERRSVENWRAKSVDLAGIRKARDVPLPLGCECFEPNGTTTTPIVILPKLKARVRP
jgi:hypothetical protein